jgi:metal-sulfur cluster biosynthetic enzyme
MNIITNNKLKCSLAVVALQQVTDPEIGLNVVDLGLIYQLDFDEAEGKIYVQMTLTTRFCPMGESIVDGVTDALRTNFCGYDVTVDLIFDPVWKAERISEEGKCFLNK